MSYRFAILLGVVLLSGCATYADRLVHVQAQFTGGSVETALKTLDGGLTRRCDRDVLTLDRAVLELCDGRPRDAEQTLRKVRDEFDSRENALLQGKGLSMLTDAQSENYHGEDYEKVLIRAMLCISNLMGDGGDAQAYAYQVAEKQQQIIDAGTNPEGANPKLAYRRVALGAYLNAALREQTHTNFDDVERSHAVVCSWQPDFPYGPQDLERARHGAHSPPGCGVLYVITLVGVGPHKEETVEVASTVSLLIADRILSALGDQTLPPNIAPVKVPKVVRTVHEVGSVGVKVDGKPLGQTATITDIGTMAVEQHEAVFPQIVAEAVVRRITKKAVVYGAKEVMGVEKYSWQSLLMDVGGVIWEATESADTRCWGLLPDKIQVLRLELPAGKHEITLESLNAGGYPLGRPVSQSVDIVDARNTYLLGNFPYGNLIGKLLTNTP